MTYTFLASSENREEWLEARKSGVTASEISILASSGTTTWLRLKAEKAGLSRPWGGNQHSAWGHEREPAIASMMSEKYPWLEANTHLVSHDADPRWMATPDMIGSAGLCQIKTELTADGKGPTDPAKKHVDQCQWEMFVTGMDENILVYELYEDTPLGFRVFDPFAPLIEFPIPRNEKRIGELVEIAEGFLAMGEPSPMDALIADYADVQQRKASVLADEKALKEKALAEIGDRDTYKHVSELGSVTLSTSKPRKSLDKTAIERDFELSDEHYKTITPEPSLRVTPAKDVA